MMVKNRPIPTPMAALMDLGIIRASHCRRPKMVRAKKMIPSRKTAATASLYVMGPVPCVRVNVDYLG